MQRLHVAYMWTSWGGQALACCVYIKELQCFGTKSEALQCYHNSMQHSIIMTMDDFGVAITVPDQLLSIHLVSLSPT
jgi:hypothetical protein